MENNKKLDENLNEDLKHMVLNTHESVLQTKIIPSIKLFIEPFYKCNYNCSYCYLSPQSRKNSKEMDLNKLYWFLEKKFITGIDYYIYKKQKIPKIMYLVLMGGELSIKSLKWNINFIKNLLKIFNNYFDEVNITYLTNLFRSANYYKDLIKNIEKDLKENSYISIVSSFHENFADIKEYIKKIIDLYKNKIKIRGQIFKTKEEIYQFKNLTEELDYCFKNDLINIKYLNQLNYVDFFEKYESILRPVKCYAYSYKIKPDLTILHRCEMQKLNLFNFKPKPYYFCIKRCSCADDERGYRKEYFLK